MALKIGVIGAGRIGKVHAETLVQRVPNAEVAAVADVIPAAAKELAERLHIPKATADYKEILADKSIDAIAICSATDTHSQ
ncbi:MAG: Gfo/Idh/MocA family oxidoreductase, partial [Chloroflexota bacterium]